MANITSDNVKNRHRKRPQRPRAEYRIQHKAKFGAGTWEFDGDGTALAQIDLLGYDWYYNWDTTPCVDMGSSTAEYIPMIWGANDMSKIGTLPAGTHLLGFNEPDNFEQADMTVAEALALWPSLEATGRTLGSPACTTPQTLGGSWLDEFMQGGPTVDFMAVHYYTTNPDVREFKRWLKLVYGKYQRPIWVTEWALIDWYHLDRFTKREVLRFARDASNMMDKLDFVERQSWFSPNEYVYYGALANTYLFQDETLTLTRIGEEFQELIGGAVG